jgi:lysozyme family protein
MNDSFDTAMKFVLQWEAGYSNHPADQGGETNRGITSAVYMAYRSKRGLPGRSVRLISDLEVREIYRVQYWDAVGTSLLPPKLALCHFDWAVNSGTNRAIKTLQRLVGVSADGTLGPLTKQAIAAATATHQEIWLCDRYNAIREAYYRRWGVGSQRVFLDGWLNRLNALRLLIAG